jgi:hypothetical protein
MRFTVVAIAALFSLALAAPTPEPAAEAQPEALEARACQDGTYRCTNNKQEVCIFGIWMLNPDCFGVGCRRPGLAYPPACPY